MDSLSSILKETYLVIRRQNSTLKERRQRLKEYLLTEVSRWTIRIIINDSEREELKNYIFYPREFSGTEESAPFSVRLQYRGLVDSSGEYLLHDLVFGNFEKHQEPYRYEWDKNDPYRLQKSLFLMDVLNEIAVLLQSGKIEGISFLAYMDDGLGPERMKYFTKLYNRLGKDKFEMKYDSEIHNYVILPKDKIE